MTPFFFRSLSKTFATAAIAASVLFVGCDSTETPALATATAPAAVPGSDQPPYSGPADNTGAAAQFPLTLTSGSTVDPANAPNITARAAILVDNRGRVLFEKNADARVPVASTQKLLLGLMVAERGNLSGTITVQESDTWCEPTMMGIKPGQTFTREHLLLAVLVRSSNDIARALARDHSGSESAFAAAMNVRARQLGMFNSHFTNSNGLPSPPGQYSTARDLVKLAQACQRNGFVRQAIATKGMYFRFPDGTTKPVSNTNQVLRHFPYCTGMKTGYTNAAGRCLVSSASYGGKDVIAVILGSTSPKVWEESEALLKYGLGL